MTAYVPIPTTDADANSPFDEDLLEKISLNPIAWAEDDPSVPFTPHKASPHFLDFGEGVSGDLILSTGVATRGIYNCSRFTINIGQVVTVQDDIIIIRANTEIIINGTLECLRVDANPTVGSSPTAGFNQVLMGGSGGGGGGKDAGGATGRSGATSFGLASGAGGPSSTNGTDGANRPLSSSGAPHGGHAALTLGPISWYGGSNGGNGQDEGSGGGLGGTGGGCIILISPSIVIGPSGTVSVAGQDGVSTGSGHGSGGGGGGGLLITVSTASILLQPGTTDVSGGAGGFSSTGGDGGLGGNGQLLDLYPPLFQG